MDVRQGAAKGEEGNGNRWKEMGRTTSSWYMYARVFEPALVDELEEVVDAGGGCFHEQDRHLPRARHFWLR